MAAFYGWSDEAILRLPLRRFNAYVSCIDALQAEQALMQARIAAYPHFSKENQQKAIREWQDAARKGAMRRGERGRTGTDYPGTRSGEPGDQAHDGEPAG